MSIEQDEKVHFNKCNSSFWIDAEIMLLKPDELPLISDMQTHTSENLEPAHAITFLFNLKQILRCRYSHREQLLQVSNDQYVVLYHKHLK